MQVIKNTEEVTSEQPTIIPFEKFPSIEFGRKQINELKSLIEKLNIKKEFLIKKVETTSDLYDKNELEITLIKNDMELAKHHTSVIKKEAEINEYMNKTIIPNLKEVVENFNMLIERAKIVSENDEVLKSVLEQTDWKLMDDNYDFRINHYLAIKNYLANKKAPN